LQFLGTPQETLQKSQPTFLPTGQEAKQFIQQQAEPYLPENYLKPQSKGEEAFDEIVATTTALATPFLGKAPSLLKSVGVASVGQGAKELAKLFSFPEETANNIKLGVMIPASIFGTRGTIRKTSQQSYKKAEQALKNATISPDKLRDNLLKVYDEVSSNAMPAREETLKILKPVVKSISVGNKIPVKKVWDLKKDMNAWLGNYKTPKQSIPFVERTSGILNESLRDYGKTNPEFLQNYSLGDQLHGALSNQSILNRFARANPSLDTAIKHPLTKILLYGAPKIAGLGSLAKPSTLPAVGAALGAREIYRMANVMAKSPEARKIYTKAINDALKQDIKAFMTDAKRLDAIIGKEPEEGEYYEILG